MTRQITRKPPEIPDGAWKLIAKIARQYGVTQSELFGQKRGAPGRARTEAMAALDHLYNRHVIAAWFGVTRKGVEKAVLRYLMGQGPEVQSVAPPVATVPSAPPPPISAKPSPKRGLAMPLDQAVALYQLAAFGESVGLTRPEIAIYCGVTASTVSKYLALGQAGHLGPLNAPQPPAHVLIQDRMCRQVRAKLRQLQAPIKNEALLSREHAAGDDRFVKALNALGGYPGRKADTDLGTIHEALIATRKIERDAPARARAERRV